MKSPEKINKLSLPKKSSLISKSVEYLRLGLYVSVLSLMSPTAKATPLAESSICQEADICEEATGFGRSWRGSFGYTNSLKPQSEQGFHYKLMAGFVAPMYQGQSYNLQTSPEANIYLRYTFSSPFFLDLQSDSLIIRQKHSESGENIYFGDNTVGLGYQVPRGMFRVVTGTRNYAIESLDNTHAQLGASGILNIGSTISLNAGIRYIFTSSADESLEGNIGIRYFGESFGAELIGLKASQWGSDSFGGMLNLSYIFDKQPKVQAKVGTYVNHPLYSNVSTPALQMPHGLNIEVLGAPGETPAPPVQPVEAEPETQLQPNLDFSGTLDATNIRGWLEEKCSANCQITVPISQIGSLQEALKDGDNYVGERAQKTVLTVNFEGANPTDAQLAAIKELHKNSVDISSSEPSKNTQGISIANKYKITEDTQLNNLKITLTETEKHYSDILDNTSGTYPQLIKGGDNYIIKYGAEDTDVVSVQNAMFLNGRLYKINVSLNAGTAGHVPFDITVKRLLETTGVTRGIEPLGHNVPKYASFAAFTENFESVFSVAPEVTFCHQSNGAWQGLIITGGKHKERKMHRKFHLVPIPRCTLGTPVQNNNIITFPFISESGGGGSARPCRIRSVKIQINPSSE